MKHETVLKRIESLSLKIDNIINKDKVYLSFIIKEMHTNNPKYDFWINDSRLTNKTIKEAELIVDTLLCI